ncbi:MAG: outer membrane protein assembly factor BamB [Thiotrichales bacterium]
MKAFLITIALAGVLSACAGGTDNADPPTPLGDIETTLGVGSVWSRDTGAGTGKAYFRLQPFVFDQKVFVAGHDGAIGGYQLANGAPSWRIDTKQTISAGVSGGPGMVAFGTSEGEVIALAANDGSPLWRRALSGMITAIAPAVDGVLVVRSGDGYVTALNARNGEINWKFNRQVPALSLHTQSVPVVDRGVVFVGLDDGRLAMVSLADGSMVWDRSVAVAQGRSELERMVDIDGRIVLDGETVYAVTYQGRIAAVNAVSGQLAWAQDASSVYGLAVDRERVYYTDANSVVWALDRRNGASLWKQDALKFRRATVPAVLGDAVVVADYEGYLHWLDRNSGRITARVRADKDGVLADPVQVDGRLMVLGRSGELSLWQTGVTR